MNKIRFEWVDALKFLGIFAIYIGHLGDAAGRIYPFVFTYHVPLFFFVAGFFSKNSKSTHFPMFVLEKAKRLLLPYFTFALLSLFFVSINSNSDLQSIMSHIADIFYGVRNNPFVGSIWFVNCLFVIIVIDRIFKLFIENNYIMLAISFAFYLFSVSFLGHNPLSNPEWFWNADSAISYWWVMALGRCMFNSLCESPLFKVSIKGMILFIPLSIITLYQLFTSKSIIADIVNNSIPLIQKTLAFSMFNSAFTTICIIIFNVYIAKIICSCESINATGRNTLNICGLESITKLLIPTGIAALGLTFGLPNPIAAIIYTIGCLYISNKIGYWLSKNVGTPFKV